MKTKKVSYRKRKNPIENFIYEKVIFWRFPEFEKFHMTIKFPSPHFEVWLSKNHAKREFPGPSVNPF